MGVAGSLEAVSEQVDEGRVGGAVGRGGGDAGDVVEGVAEAGLHAQPGGGVGRGTGRAARVAAWGRGGWDEDGGVCTRRLKCEGKILFTGEKMDVDEMSTRRLFLSFLRKLSPFSQIVYLYVRLIFGYVH